MQSNVNINEVFTSLDARKAEALATIAKYGEADRAEASRVALIYDRCDQTSIKHLEDTAKFLKRDFVPLVQTPTNKLGVNQMQLLSLDTNSKLAKTNAKQDDYMFVGLSMMPNDRLCPGSKAAGCMEVCLQSAGMGKFSNVAQARQAKSDFFMSNREAFMAQLVKEMKSKVRTATKKAKTLAVRLNVLSDVQWEDIPVTLDGVVYSNIMEAFPMVQFYDYTKLASRLSKALPANYDLTFSYSARPTYQKQVSLALRNDNTKMAVVFAGEFPLTFMGRKVIDGDAQDARFLDAQGVIVGLKAKGKAKTVKNDFIVH